MLQQVVFKSIKKVLKIVFQLIEHNCDKQTCKQRKTKTS
jgi:hypothetical protein